jgi:hypothetical protein
MTTQTEVESQGGEDDREDEKCFSP